MLSHLATSYIDAHLESAIRIFETKSNQIASIGFLDLLFQRMRNLVVWNSRNICLQFTRLEIRNPGVGKVLYSQSRLSQRIFHIYSSSWVASISHTVSIFIWLSLLSLFPLCVSFMKILDTEFSLYISGLPSFYILNLITTEKILSQIKSHSLSLKEGHGQAFEGHSAHYTVLILKILLREHIYFKFLSYSRGSVTHL